jgi:hypothetical protein
VLRVATERNAPLLFGGEGNSHRDVPLPPAGKGKSGVSGTIFFKEASFTATRNLNTGRKLLLN